VTELGSFQPRLSDWIDDTSVFIVVTLDKNRHIVNGTAMT
jgi:hypothetical protein